MPIDPKGCAHLNFSSSVAINRLSDSGNFMADVTIRCEDCQAPFEFVGLPFGLNLSGAATSFDCLEGRFAIVPQGTQQNPHVAPSFTITQGKREIQ